MPPPTPSVSLADFPEVSAFLERIENASSEDLYMSIASLFQSVMVLNNIIIGIARYYYVYT